MKKGHGIVGVAWKAFREWKKNPSKQKDPLLEKMIQDVFRVIKNKNKRKA